ncbi:MAG: hypothetical protein ABJC04_02820 [Verrucomicrobiota bacterium]
MNEPLALVFYEKLLPGQQLVNRLQDLNYRVQAITDAIRLEAEVRQLKPLLLIAEFPADNPIVRNAIQNLKSDSETGHIPVLAYVGNTDMISSQNARQAGVNLIVSETGVLDQLPQLLEQLLQLD